ncbi:MAG TPA: glutathione synthetase [Ignavibacteria bacterium]|nr:glutathione synthetase [Ignavibacteria bacterium]
MKIGFVVNRLETEQAGYTTIRLAVAAISLGHKVSIMSVGDFSYADDECVYASAYNATKKSAATPASLVKAIRAKNSKRTKIKVDDLDVLLLRNDPAEDVARPWAQFAGVNFGKLLIKKGVIVLNDPNGLAKAFNKTYFQTFPEAVRPRTIISRDAREIKNFFKEEGGRIVLKPLQGSGGQNVFLVKKKDLSNLNQMIEAICRDGYAVAQQYLPKATEHGDIRLFVMNGKPLRYKGKYAAFRRAQTSGDMRSNISAGGKIYPVKVNDEMLELAEIVRPKLIEDGMFLVGLDIVGDMLMEVNVFSPGGLGSAQKLEGVNFSHAVIQALEDKVRYMKHYDHQLGNLELATL